MPCTSCIEDYKKRFVKRSAGKLIFRKVYDVIFDGTDDQNIEFIMATSSESVPVLPAQGASYDPPYDYMYVTGKYIEAIKGPHFYSVAVDYENGVTIGDTEIPQNPLLEKPIVLWGTRKRPEKIDRDVNDKPIINSVGDTPSSPLSEDEYDTSLTFTRNEATYDPLVMGELKGKKNNSTFLKFIASMVIIDDITAEKFWLNKKAYYKMRYEFLISWTLWWRLILDEGYYTKSGNLKTRILDDSTPAQPVVEPVPLDGLGQKLAIGANAVFIPYETKRSADFSVLKISDADVYETE